MKLFYKPGACSLSPHIVLREAGLPFDLIKVDTKAGVTAEGADYKAINPKGAVPALQLDDGRVLTEGAAIVQFIADRAPEKKLAPASGTWERSQLQEWLNYVGTEIHKSYGPLFHPAIPEETKSILREALSNKLGWVASQLAERPFLTGQSFAVADAYLFVVLGWSPRVGIDLAKWPALVAFRARVGERKAVRDALAAEGLSL